jgi:two-component system, NtrC family, sensor kinase
LVQTEKMSTLGTLVAGIAHEINNPTSFIYENLHYANEYIKDLLQVVHLYQKYYPIPVPEIQSHAQVVDLDFLIQDLPKVISSMANGAERIRHLVQSLRNFSRRDFSQMQSVDIHEGIETTLLILQNRLKANSDRPSIEVIKEYGELPLVECYPSQLNQVFMNILGNAIDALEELKIEKLLAPGGISASEVIRKRANRSVAQVEDSKELKVQELKSESLLEKSKLESDDSSLNSATLSNQSSNLKPATPTNSQPATFWIRIRTEISSNDRIIVRIADNGPGMAQEVKKQLFDAFFTTKPWGKGTGLGLSISYQIVVEKHKGTLHCESTPGLGKEFSIEIPVRHSSDAITNASASVAAG